MRMDTHELLVKLVVLLHIPATLGLFYGEPYASQSLEVCQGTSFKPTCGHNEVVFIQNATYGRMRLGNCVTVDMGFLGCQVNVLSILHRLCSGKQSCSVTVPNEDFVMMRPCVELMSYLQVHYTCVPVISARDYPCSPQNILKVLPHQGIISSERSSSECGSTNTVWLIEAKAGQRVNVTLINFSFPPGSRDTSMEACGTFVRDVTSRKEEYLCDIKALEHHVVFSLGNAVEVVVGHTNRDHQFLLQYKMLGCADPSVGVDSWTKREGNKVVIGCKESDVEHTMTCVGTTWLGSYHNCSANAEVIVPETEGESFSLTSLPRGLVITAVLAIALVVGTTIVVVGIFLVRRQRNGYSDDSAYSINHMDNKHNHQAYRSTKDHRENLWLDRSSGPNSAIHQHQTPTLQRCYQYTGTPTVTPEKRHEYTHIWDRPLPAPESQHSC